MFEKNNLTIALNVLYKKEEEKCPASVYLDISNHNSTCEKKNSVNDSTQRKKRMALSRSKKLSTLLRGITSKHHGNFYYLNCLHFFRTGNKLAFHEKM